MIDYERDTQQQTIPVGQVKIVGIGGAGANMLEKVCKDGADASTMLALNSDQRTLAAARMGQKIQLGKNLTMGLGAGGDPEVGLKAAQEVEAEIREALKNQKIVFLCVGLGGGTGSGAAPLVTRIAREQGAFVVVFATMPFDFEGKRRKDQAETALNELSVLASALITFENGKMGELVLAKQGIHEAFTAADVMISQSITAVTRLVIKPGIINVGLDDLVSALKATKSRCLFGSGIADGENRSNQALKNAFTSPLLDQGALLNSATTVLVYICGGPSMSLHEVELVMKELSKKVPENAHILFGAAVDESMKNNLSVTLISALPEAMLLNQQFRGQEKEVQVEGRVQSRIEAEPVAAPEVIVRDEPVEAFVEPKPEVKSIPEPVEVKMEEIAKPSSQSAAVEVSRPISQEDTKPKADFEVEDKIDLTPRIKWDELNARKKALASESSEKESVGIIAEASTEGNKVVLSSFSKPVTKTVQKEETAPVNLISEPKPEEVVIKSEPIVQEATKEETYSDVISKEIEESPTTSHLPPKREKRDIPVRLGAANRAEQASSETSLDGGPKGKFSGEQPNILGGEDLDIPPFLRNR